MPTFDNMWAGVLRIIKDCKFSAMVMETGATELSLSYWQNNLVYCLFYYEGLGFTIYKLRFVSQTVKIFERIPVNEKR